MVQCNWWYAKQNDIESFAHAICAIIIHNNERKKIMLRRMKEENVKH